MFSTLLRTFGFAATLAAFVLASQMATAADPTPPRKSQAPTTTYTYKIIETIPEQELTEIPPEEPCPNCVPILAMLVGPLPPMPTLPRPSCNVLAPLGRLWHFGGEEPPNRYHHSQFHPVPARPVFEPQTPTGPAIVSVAQLPPRPVPLPLAPIPAGQDSPPIKPVPLPDALPDWPAPTPVPKSPEPEPAPTEPLLAPLSATSEQPAAPRPEQAHPGTRTGYMERIAPTKPKSHDGWVSVVHKE